MHLASKLKAAFNNDDGTITRKKLEYVLKRLNPSFTKEELHTLFDIADKNRDGLIGHNEFVDFVCFLDSDACDSVHTHEHEQEAQRKYERPWENSSAVVKDSVHMLYRLVAEIDIDPTIEKEQFTKMGLLHALEPDGIWVVIKSEMEVEFEQEHDLRKQTLVKKLFERLYSMEFKARIRSCSGKIDLEQLVSLTWPKLQGSDKKLVHSWLLEFKMKDVVRRFFLKATQNEPLQLQVEDIKYMFDHLDVNKDGKITMSEFRKHGFLTKKEIEQLVKKFDFVEKDHSIQIEEIMKVVFAQSQSDFADSLKAAFASKNSF